MIKIYLNFILFFFLWEGFAPQSLSQTAPWPTAKTTTLAPISDETFLKLESSFMEIIKPDSPYAREFDEVKKTDPFFARLLMQEWMKYTPDTTSDTDDKECSSRPWFDRQLNKNSNSSPDSIEKEIKQYLEQCDQKIQSDWKWLPIATYRSTMIKLNPLENPYGRQVLFNLPQGNKVKGYLALKGDNRRRPLIILRLGVFSDASHFVLERFLYLQLFEQSPFNILILESNSSRESILRNKTLALGGFDEGIQNFLIAKELKNPRQPISSLIDSIHLAAFSFGGHGAFFSALLDQLNINNLKGKQSKASVISSVLAYCPLVHFQETLTSHLDSPKAPWLNWWVFTRLREMNGKLDGFNISKSENFISNLVLWMKKHYSGPVAFDPSLPLPQEMKKYLRDYWRENDFWPFYKDIHTPVFIFATQEDVLVPLHLNTGRIVSGSMELGNSQIQTHILKAGVHCSLTGSYLWKPLTSLSQAYFLRHSSYRLEKKELSIPLSPEEFARISSVPSSRISWTLHQGETLNKFYLSLKLNKIYFKERLSFDYKEIGLVPSDFEKTKDLLNRWISQNLKFETAGNAQSGYQLVISWYL